MSVALLITHRGDFYTIDKVADEVGRRGVEPLRVDIDTFPASLGLDLRVDGDGLSPQLILGDRVIAPDQVVGVWCRRIWAAPAPEGLTPEVAQVCVRESNTARDAWLAGLEDHAVTWVNRVDRHLAAENKARQLSAARACGLATPPTLITNRPEAARAFWHAHEGDVVAKMLTSYARSMKGDVPKVYTNRVTEADLEGLEGLRVSPMIFQRRVEKDHELRAIVVGDQVFAGAIDASRSERGAIDWRRTESTAAGWTQGRVSEDLISRLVALARRLGLVYGAADVIITPEGEPVFLEINPAGEWGMIERDTGAPIAAAIAEALVGDR